MNEAASKPAPKELNLEHRVEQLHKLRAIKAQIDTEYKKKVTPYILADQQLCAELMTYLREHGLKTANTNTQGSITWVDKDTYPIEDQVAFSGFVIETRGWEYIDWKANTTAVKGFIKENDGELPPGLRLSEHPYLRVNSPKTSRTVKAKGFDIDEEETVTNNSEGTD